MSSNTIEQDKTQIISLTEPERGEAIARAIMRHARFAGRQGPYQNNNSMKSHLIGCLGEVGVARYLHAPLPDPLTINNYDLMIDGKQIEIKTWDIDQYARFGRAITHAQLASKMHVHSIVWCSVHAYVSIDKTRKQTVNVDVMIHGANSPHAVALRPIIITGQGIANHQLTHEQVGPVDFLVCGDGHIHNPSRQRH